MCSSVGEHARSPGSISRTKTPRTTLWRGAVLKHSHFFGPQGHLTAARDGAGRQPHLVSLEQKAAAAPQDPGLLSRRHSGLAGLPLCACAPRPALLTRLSLPVRARALLESGSHSHALVSRASSRPGSAPCRALPNQAPTPPPTHVSGTQVPRPALASLPARARPLYPQRVSVVTLVRQAERHRFPRCWSESGLTQPRGFEFARPSAPHPIPGHFPAVSKPAFLPVLRKLKLQRLGLHLPFGLCLHRSLCS